MFAKAADIKANRLLRKHLRLRQKLSLYWLGGFWVKSQTSQWYWLGDCLGYGYMYWIPPSGRQRVAGLVRLGIYPTDPQSVQLPTARLPKAEVILGQKLIIDAMEHEIKNIACMWWLTPADFHFEQIMNLIWRLIRLPFGGGSWIVK